MNQGYWRYWGKASAADNDSGAKYHLLPYHCLDVAIAEKVGRVRKCVGWRK